VEQVVATMKANVAKARAAVLALAARLPDPTQSNAHGAMKFAVMTSPDAVRDDVRLRYRLLLG
jgi:hypothetical protein